VKLYGWVRHLYRDEGISHEERMRLKRRERFRAANDIALAIDGGPGFYDDDPPCCDYDCELCYGTDAIDRLGAFPLPPLTHTLALEAA
jgi:hypothetical protein